MSNDPSSLLATLAQSSAAIVAIVGGFLVSRLVALSSEREGLRRQLFQARDRLARVSEQYDSAHGYRLQNSKSDFYNWVIEEVVRNDPRTDWEALISQNVPKGSSVEEMRPYLDEMKSNVASLRTNALRYIRPRDNTRLDLSNLEDRGLQVSRDERETYQYIVDYIAETELPAESTSLYHPVMPILRPSAMMASDSVTSSRRLDDSIKEEENFQRQKLMLEAETDRLSGELEQIGRPAGVLSAIAILSLYSLLGIVAPVIVLAISPTTLATCWTIALVAMFVIGLLAVLAYIFWYTKTLDDPVDD